MRVAVSASDVVIAIEVVFVVMEVVMEVVI